MTRHVARILDANANRAREAMRVMEDFARFALDDAELTSKLKSLRHEFREAISRLPAGSIEVNRDTPGDVGTRITTSSEREREDIGAVVVAAGKRLSEALRSIEEFAKTLCPDVSSHVEAIRYRGYGVERQLHARLNVAPTRGGARQWRVCVLLTESLCTRRPWLDVLDAAIEGGADCIQLREKDLPDGKRLGRATAVVRKCREARIACIINDRPDIAALAHADGVHVGQSDLPATHVRMMCGRTMLIGVSTTNIVQAEAAVRCGADYVGLGPMFESTTKIKPDIAGPDYAREYLGTFELPHLAIGGISEHNVHELVEVGVRGVAVSSCVCGADDPARVVNALKNALPESGAQTESTSR